LTIVINLKEMRGFENPTFLPNTMAFCGWLS